MKKSLFLVLFAFLFAGIATADELIVKNVSLSEREGTDYWYASLEVALETEECLTGDSLVVIDDIYTDITITKVARINFNDHFCHSSVQLAAEKSYDYPLALYNLQMYDNITTTSDMTASLILNNVQTGYDVTLDNMGDSCVIVGGEYAIINSSIDNLILSGDITITELQFTQPFSVQNWDSQTSANVVVKPMFDLTDTIQITKEGGAVFECIDYVSGNNLKMVYDDGNYLYESPTSTCGLSLGKSNTLFAIVQYAAVNETTGKKYLDILEAINEANEGETVKMLADYGSNLTIDKPMTLDMNGFSLSNNTLWFPRFDGSVYVKNGSVGNIDGASGDQNFSGTIYLDNMKVSNDVYTDGRTLYISGGKFSKLRQTGETSMAKGHIYLSGTVEMATDFSNGIYLYDYADLGCALTMNVPSALLPAERKYFFNKGDATDAEIKKSNKPNDDRDIIAAHNGTFAELTYMSF
ncbi:MAG: hypothetical protein MJZ48_03450, partial [Paludibacteraceae bacterium]|nr:hypothetical protein [Paludibacteraceae bacterium]